MFYKEKDLFSSATHHPKPISQIAENVTIVTGKEIDAMNAHSVAEVLNRVTGLFVNFQTGVGTMGSPSLLKMQGAEERHALVMVDGVPLNWLNQGSAETNTIPVDIIERIEIIKGPASSAWGSALGGVIHVITKSAGGSARPTGSVQASLGEMNTRDYSAQVAGKAGNLGYYLFGGRQESDGPGSSREFENNAFYSKFAYDGINGVDVNLSMGLSDPDQGLGDLKLDDIDDIADINAAGDNRTFWATAQVDATLSRNIALNLRLYRLDQKFALTNNVLGMGYYGEKGDLFQKSVYDEAVTGGNAQLVWQGLGHTTVLGVDYKRGELDQTIMFGPLLRNSGAPERLIANPTMNNKAVYINTTLLAGRLTVTPGIRYDYSSITDDFISPSLGVAWRLGDETILRGSVARGFTAPPLLSSSAGGLLLDPNPALTNEKAWTYQLGLESAALQYVWVKTTLFYHDVEDIFTRERYAAGPPSYNDLIVNSGSSRRKGFEIEVETIPLWHLTLRSGFSYIKLDPASESGAEDIYKNTVGVTYENPALFTAELFGHYVWWDSQNSPDSSYDDFIWDLNFMKRLYSRGEYSVELLFTAHNLFSGDLFLVADNPNPGRWVEAGLKFRF